MADLAASIITLVDAAAKTVGFIEKVYRAKAEASVLLTKVKDLSQCVDRINNILKTQSEIQNWRGVLDAEKEMRKALNITMVECRKTLDEINSKLAPLETSDDMKLIERIGFVRSKSKRASLEAIIDHHLQDLHQMHTALSGLSNTVDHAAMHSLLVKLVSLLDPNQATSEQLSPLLRPITSQSEPPPQPLQSDPSSTPGSPITHESLPFNRGRGGSLSATVTNDSTQYNIPNDHSPREPSNSREQSKSRPNKNTGKDGNHRNDEDPLILAVRDGDHTQIRVLLTEGANVDCVDSDDYTIIHLAVTRESGSDQILTTILNCDRVSKDLIDTVNDERKTPLMLLAEKAEAALSCKLAKMLIENDCDINIKDGPGRTALYHVVRESWTPERQNFAELLISNGAEVESLSKLGRDKIKDFRLVFERWNAFCEGNSDASIELQRTVSSGESSVTSQNAEPTRRASRGSIVSLRQIMSRRRTSEGG